jgi:hypothetical protein
MNPPSPLSRIFLLGIVTLAFSAFFCHLSASIYELATTTLGVTVLLFPIEQASTKSHAVDLTCYRFDLLIANYAYVTCKL